MSSSWRWGLAQRSGKSVEGYYQEIGRAGRNGVVGDCILFYSWADVINLERMLSGEATETRQRDQPRVMYDWAERKVCRHRSVVAYFGERIADCGVSCDICTGEDILAGHPITASPQPRGDATSHDDQRDTPLFEALRALRRTLANERGVPAYVIFNDATLLAMASSHPRTEDQLLAIPGVGPVKLERYGAAFLELLRD